MLIQSTTADVSIAASISTTATGRSVEVTDSGRNVAGGSQIVFSGAIDENGLGIWLANNDQNTNGATVTFSGGLDIDTGGSDCFVALSGGTVNVTGSGNTIDTTNGRLVVMADVSVGSSGVTFASMQSTGTISNTVVHLHNVDGSGTLTAATSPSPVPVRETTAS